MKKQNKEMMTRAEFDAQNVKAKRTEALQLEAGKALLQWLDNSYAEEFLPDDYDDSEIRQLKSAYAHGYNHARAEAMRRVANLVLDEINSGDDDDDEDGCDCCD